MQVRVRNLRLLRWSRGPALAAGLLALLLSGCTPGAYSLDFFREMHYQQSQRVLEPRRMPPPAGSVPRGGSPPQITFAEARDLVNPIRRTDLTTKASADLFAVNCSMCHGANGDGKSLVADRFAAQRVVPPADLTSSRVRDRTDGELNWIINHGLGNMPSFRHLLAERDIWSVVLQVRTIQGQR